MGEPDAAVPTESWRVRVHGRVQGVGFREACVREAHRLGVAGWVRNRRDGTVELLLQGPPQRLSELHAWLRQGPPGARVVRAEISRAAPPCAPCEGFDRRPTE